MPVVAARTAALASAPTEKSPGMKSFPSLHARLSHQPALSPSAPVLTREMLVENLGESLPKTWGLESEASGWPGAT